MTLVPLPQLSLVVVGADYPNKRGPTRRFELALCVTGEPIQLRPEPTNPADEQAVAVYSCRGVQIGYLSAERCGRIGSIIRSGRAITAIFQEPTTYGAVIRVAFDGDEPHLPPPSRPVEPQEWWPDPEWADEELR